MKRKLLTARAARYARAHLHPTEGTLKEATAMRLAWEDGYKAARKDLRRAIKQPDGFLSYGQMGMTTKRWLA